MTSRTVRHALVSFFVFGGLAAGAWIALVASPPNGLPVDLETHPWKRWSPGAEKMTPGPGLKPDDWFTRQRAYPFDDIPAAAKLEGFRDAQAHRDEAALRRGTGWTEAGPSNVHGRITAMAADPTNPDVVFIGAADGGVFRSVDGGANWAPVFDDMPVQSIGALAIDPNNTSTIWVGSGETNAAGDTYAGDGVYKSTDGGDTWNNVGLPLSAKIGRVEVDPNNSDRVFVAALGRLYSTNPERGVYRTENGGVTWSQVLYVADDAGAVDVRVDPTRNWVFAATWERLREPTNRRVGGLDSGIWRSQDGGDNWTKLGPANGLPADASDNGRIGLTQCASNPDVLYAYTCDDPGFFSGVYKTTDGGDNWSRVNDNSISDVTSSFGWYFGQIRVDPKDANRVFVLGVPLYRSTNGGGNWSGASGGMHVDHHALWIDPTPGSSLVYAGNDGGFYRSTNGGTAWSKRGQLPITQFYAITVDDQRPWRLYGGTQDNSTNRTWDGGIDDWDVIYGGDGFYTIVDPRDSNVIYAEYQFGGLAKSTNGGSNWNSATNGINSNDRRNWSTPVVMDPSDADVLYYGTYRLYKTVNGASFWNAISGDLTEGDPPGSLTFGTITTIDVAPTDPDAVITGADDGSVWITYDGGGSWTPIYSTFPDRWITRVAFDPTNEQILYVTLSGYKWDEYIPHLYRSSNGGTSWEDITSNLPGIPLNDVIVDPENTSRLFVASDAGVFFSNNLGDTWAMLGVNLPPTAVFDLHLHNPTRKLVAGTHGRSMWTYDLTDIVAVGDSAPLAPRVAAFPNPFRARTTLRFDVAETGRVTVEVYDIQGRFITRLVDTELLAGPTSVTWDGTNAAGARVEPGTYLYRVNGPDGRAVGKVVLAR